MASEEVMSRSYESAVSSTVMLLMVAAEIRTGDVCIILKGGRDLEFAHKTSFVQEGKHHILNSASFLPDLSVALQLFKTVLSYERH